MRHPLAALVLGSLLVSCARLRPEPPAAPAPPPVVVLMTDFGLADDAVGLMRGVILSLAPRAQVVDLTHAVEPFDVEDGARMLLDAPGLYPPGSIFIVVVDPGVGSSRRPLVARLPNGTLLIGPDNGVLDPALTHHGPAEVRALENPSWRRTEVSTTFHGRDVFAPAGGHLAAGEAFSDAGPVVKEWVGLHFPTAVVDGDAVVGEVVTIERPFGNAWTNVELGLLEMLGVKPGDELVATIESQDVSSPPASVKVRWVATFSDVPEGESLLYVHSRGAIALASNRRNFAAEHGVERGARVTLRRSP